jgi:hypothetical protein
MTLQRQPYFVSISFCSITYHDSAINSKLDFVRMMRNEVMLLYLLIEHYITIYSIIKMRYIYSSRYLTYSYTLV